MLFLCLQSTRSEIRPRANMATLSSSGGCVDMYMYGLTYSRYHLWGQWTGLTLVAFSFCPTWTWTNNIMHNFIDSTFHVTETPALTTWYPWLASYLLVLCWYFELTNSTSSIKHSLHGPWWLSGKDDSVSGTWNLLFMVGRSWIRTQVGSNLKCVVLLSKSYLKLEKKTWKKTPKPISFVMHVWYIGVHLYIM